MAVSVNWSTRVIYIPQSDLTSLGGVFYGLDVDWLRLQLKALESSGDGMSFPDTHYHETETTFSGITFARKVIFINNYTVEFEDGLYSVALSGANTNLLDVKVLNCVSVAATNSAGLITVSSGSGLSSEQDATLTAINALATELHRLQGFDSANPVTITRDGASRITTVDAGTGHVVDVTYSGSDETWTRE